MTDNDPIPMRGQHIGIGIGPKGRAPDGAGAKGFGETRPASEGPVIGLDHRDLV